MEEIEYIIWLSLLKGVSLERVYALSEYFQGAKNLFRSNINDYIASGIVSERQADQIMGHKSFPMDKYISRLESEECGVISNGESLYPAMLTQIHMPPLVLYYKGDLARNVDKAAVAVVGSRKATVNGLKNAYRLSGELASYGACIVSGLARGVDSKAHMGALDASGMTIAVMGSGINQIYPSENRKLYERIIEKGGIIFSEFPTDYPAMPENFPRRNRIISGLSYGVCIIEASEKSGSLITAGYAAEQGREVYALPGDISSKNSAGTNRLIKDGAKLVMESADIIEDIFPMLDLRPHTKKPAISLPPEENKIIEIIEEGFTTADEIIRKMEIPASDVGYLLTKLEIKQIIMKSRGFYYIK
ncbi:MAG: DNA-protecting protein DprA [Eubacteriaceae bacterium]|nr:DNA-protecting protein DprA [Eubacteriaceae bacterium]